MRFIREKKVPLLCDKFQCPICSLLDQIDFLSQKVEGIVEAWQIGASPELVTKLKAAVSFQIAERRFRTGWTLYRPSPCLRNHSSVSRSPCSKLYRGACPIPVLWAVAQVLAFAHVMCALTLQENRLNHGKSIGYA